MNLRTAANRTFLAWLLLVILSGCVGKSAAPTAVRNEPVPGPTSSRTPLSIARPISSPTAAAPTPLRPLPTPTASLQAALARPPSGWTLYSNPDYIQGLALHGRQLWAATLGGVAVWDLDTKKSVLYTTRDGLAEIQGNDIVYCPMPEERIFVAHSSGLLSVYDLALAKWSRLPITFDDGSTIKGVETLFCDSVNQRLMVGSSNGLGILDIKTGHWQRFGAEEGLNVNDILSIDVVGHAIWIAVGDKGADMIMGNTVFPFNGAAGFPSGKVNDLSVAPDASLWFAYSNGLVHYYDKKWYSYGAQMRSGIPFQSVDRVEIGPDKRIWIASAVEGICPFNPISLTCSTVYPASRSAPITSLAVGPDNVAYAGTDGAGVLILDGDQVSHLAFNRHQLVSNDVMDIGEGSDGKLWVATDRGVNKIDLSRTDDSWAVIQAQPNQLAFPAVSGLLPVPKGMWFFYQDEPRASFFDGDRWLHLDSAKGISGPVLDAAVDQRGYIWFATTEAIEVWDGATMRTYSPSVIPPGTKVYSLLNVGDGMWVGTDKGLLFYQNFQWQVVLPDIVVNAIIQDGNGGGLLLGTDQGLVRYENGQSYLWIFNLGNEIIKNPKVTSVAWDGNHHLWAGTAGQGLFFYDGTHWQQFNSATGLPTDNIRKLYTDQQGSIWIAAVTGKSGGALVRFTP